MPTYALKWSFHNEKVSKLGGVSFNLPAFRSADGFHVCPQAGACATLCYARQGRYVISTVAKAREFNLALVRTDLDRFQTLAEDDLRRIKSRIIRLHDSGDFFSQAYLDTWFRVIQKFPEKQFYAYTKSIHLDYTRQPDNLQIVQSYGGLMDAAIDQTKSHARIFTSHYQRRAAGYVNGNINDAPAIRGDRAIGLVYHGVRNLKPGQIRWLREVKDSR